MMGADSKICRLCVQILEVDVPYSPLTDNNAFLQNLKFLSPRIVKNLKLTEDPIICKTCGNTLRKLADFKETVIANELQIQHNEKTNLKAFLQALSEDVKAICRLCLKVSQKKGKLSKNWQDRSRLLSECNIDMNVNIAAPIKICDVCDVTLQMMRDFISQCSKNDKHIVDFAVKKGKELVLEDLFTIFSPESRTLKKSKTEDINNVLRKDKNDSSKNKKLGQNEKAKKEKPVTLSVSNKGGQNKSYKNNSILKYMTKKEMQGANILPEEESFNITRTPNTYKKKKPVKKYNRTISAEMPSTSRGSPSMRNLLDRKYVLKKMNEQLRQLHTSIDASPLLDVTDVTLDVDSDGLVQEEATSEYNVTQELIDVLEGRLNDKDINYATQELLDVLEGRLDDDEGSQNGDNEVADLIVTVEIETQPKKKRGRPQKLPPAVESKDPSPVNSTVPANSKQKNVVEIVAIPNKKETKKTATKTSKDVKSTSEEKRQDLTQKTIIMSFKNMRNIKTLKSQEDENDESIESSNISKSVETAVEVTKNLKKTNGSNSEKVSKLEAHATNKAAKDKSEESAHKEAADAPKNTKAPKKRTVKTKEKEESAHEEDADVPKNTKAPKKTTIKTKQTEEESAHKEDADVPKNTKAPKKTTVKTKQTEEESAHKEDADVPKNTKAPKKTTVKTKQTEEESAHKEDADVPKNTKAPKKTTVKTKQTEEQSAHKEDADVPKNTKAPRKRTVKTKENPDNTSPPKKRAKKATIETDTSKSASEVGSKKLPEDDQLPPNATGDEADGNTDGDELVEIKRLENRPVMVTIIKGKKRTNKAQLDKTWQELIGTTNREPEEGDEIQPVKKRRGRPRLPENLRKQQKIKREVKWLFCDQCPFKTYSKKSFVQHHIIHNVMSSVQTFDCNVCIFKTTNAELLEQHKLSHDTPDLTFKCIFCDHVFKRKVSCMYHTLRHDDKDVANQFYCTVFNVAADEEYFECYQCDYTNVEESPMPDHVIDHTIQKLKNPLVAKFKCDWCQYRTKSEDNLKRHKNLHQEKTKKPLVKKEMKKETEDGSESQNEEEIPLPIFNCDQCLYVTRNRRSLSNHRGIKHNRQIHPTATAKLATAKAIAEGLPVYYCNECSYRTYRKLNMPRHALVHRTKENMEFFECPHCIFETKHRRSYTRHLEIIHSVLM